MPKSARRAGQRPPISASSRFVVSGLVPMISAAVIGLEVRMPRKSAALKPATPTTPSTRKARALRRNARSPGPSARRSHSRMPSAAKTKRPAAALQVAAPAERSASLRNSSPRTPRPARSARRRSLRCAAGLGVGVFGQVGEGHLGSPSGGNAPVCHSVPVLNMASFFHLFSENEKTMDRLNWTTSAFSLRWHGTARCRGRRDSLASGWRRSRAGSSGSSRAWACRSAPSAGL